MFTALVFVRVGLAACNSIPNAMSALGVGTYRTEDATLLFETTYLGRRPPRGFDSGSWHPPYKGALGEVADRAYLIPGESKGFVVVPDGVCVGSPDDDHEPGPIDVRKLVAVLVFFGAPEPDPQAIVYAPTEDICREISDSAVIKDCVVGKLAPTTDDASRDAVWIPVPTREQLEYLTHTKRTPSVRVAVFARGDEVGSVATRVEEIAAFRRCADHCSEFAEDKGGLACLDELYEGYVVNGAIGYRRDHSLCGVQMPDLPPNDFRLHCEGTGKDSNLERCTPNPREETALWTDDCGNVRVPFLWASVRKAKAPHHGNDKDREVWGGWAAGRDTDGGDPERIELPGREFVGSTPFTGRGGDGASIRPWQPHIEIDQTRAASKQALVVKGIVDQGDSIVHFLPRLSVSYFCKNAGIYDACLGIEEKKEEAGKYEMRCVWSDTSNGKLSDCVTSADSRYFACEGGAFAGRPCTRHRHCGDGGACRGTPRCQSKGAVWTRGDPPCAAKGDGPPGSGCCYNDGQCAGEDEQCGYRLFDVRDQPVGGVVQSPRKVTGGSGHGRRGFCEHAPDRECSAHNPCTSSQGECRGYELGLD